MKLVQFRITEFRSVGDSGWIDAHDVTTLIGTNESGKTNLLLPLWKLNPARGGEIKPTADYPRKRYAEIRAMEKGERPIFIRARFEVTAALAGQLAELVKADAGSLRIVEVQRNFDGDYFVGFPELTIAPMSTSDVEGRMQETLDAVEKSLVGLDEESANLPRRLMKALERALMLLADGADQPLDSDRATALVDVLKRVSSTKAGAYGEPGQQYATLVRELVAHAERLSRSDVEGQVVELVKQRMPSFVYYSNYGNLDSEIYLPHVIEDLKRLDELGAHAAAKARTLRVLFDFVNLSPSEIHALGKEAGTPQKPNPSKEEVAAEAERKREREILLHSAGTALTHKFRDWWRQGAYRFRFNADGNHFRIWVSDDKRQEEVELEGRSTGLQWFLSFFLTFLVESEEAHAGAILLLDEPGVSLHPIAQEDLSAFFEQLSRENQILYTTHSPFMVDPDHLDRVRAVYVDDSGLSAVSPDLRAVEKTKERTGSVYPVHAALGLSVSRTLLIGCEPVVVEGASDQIYLSAMKNYLVRHGLFAPRNELLFFPAGGARGISAVVAVLAGANEERPFVLLDGDREGRQKAEQLRSGTYSDCKDRVVIVDEVCSMPSCEIEDLWPHAFLAGELTKYLRGPDQEFDELADAARPIVPQVEAYCEKHKIDLVKPGWKVEVAERVKRRLSARPQSISKDDPKVAKWVTLFERIVATSGGPVA